MTQTDIAAPPAWRTDPARVKRIGMLYGDVLFIAGHVDPRVASAPVWHEDAGASLREVTRDEALEYDLRTVIRQALDYGCGALWLIPTRGTPGRGDSPILRDWAPEANAILRAPGQFLAHELSSDGKLAGLIVQRRDASGKGVGMPVGVYAPWVADAWGFGGALVEGVDPERIAEGLALAAYALGVQLRFSPSYTGMSLLRRTLAHRRVAIPPLSPPMAVLVHAHRPTYLQWARALPAGTAALTKYDRNSSFVASFGEVPVGDPLPTARYVDKCPGLYHVVSFSPPHDWPGSLPGPFRVGEVGTAGEYPASMPPGGDCWAWEPQLRLAFARGWAVGIDQGYYWPRNQVHDLGRQWREAIWRARGEAERYGGVAGAVAKAIIKRAGVATIGRLLQRGGRMAVQLDEAIAQGWDIDWLETDDYGDPTGVAEVRAAQRQTDLQQPAWWSTIIANANERLLGALYDHAAAHPVAAYVDAVYCAQTWGAGDPALAAGLGKWKRESGLTLTRGDAAEWDALATANARINRYARWAGEEVAE